MKVLAHQLISHSQNKVCKNYAMKFPKLCNEISQTSYLQKIRSMKIKHLYCDMCMSPCLDKCSGIWVFVHSELSGCMVSKSCLLPIPVHMLSISHSHTLCVCVCVYMHFTHICIIIICMFELIRVCTKVTGSYY